MRSAFAQLPLACLVVALNSPAAFAATPEERKRADDDFLRNLAAAQTDYLNCIGKAVRFALTMEMRVRAIILWDTVEVCRQRRVDAFMIEMSAWQRSNGAVIPADEIRKQAEWEARRQDDLLVAEEQSKKAEESVKPDAPITTPRGASPQPKVTRQPLKTNGAP